MNNVILTYETGIDWNHDRHCDLCGWFVNEYENHRARQICRKGAWEERPEWSKEDHHFERIGAVDFSSEFIANSPYDSRDYDKNKYKDVYAYSTNTPDGVSCFAVNGYLRNGKIPLGLSEVEIIARINAMNAEISDFVVKKMMTSFRGMWFKPGDPFVKMLDGCLEGMNETHKPALFVEKGFMSTTRSVETMNEYARQRDNSLCHVYISVTTEPGVVAIPLSHDMGTTEKANDKEVLFQSGRPYYIIGIRRTWRGGELYDYYINLLATDRRIETC